MLCTDILFIIMNNYFIEMFQKLKYKYICIYIYILAMEKYKKNYIIFFLMVLNDIIRICYRIISIKNSYLYY